MAIGCMNSWLSDDGSQIFTSLVVEFPTHLKNMFVKLDIIRKVRGGNKKIFELPPASYNLEIAGWKIHTF